FYIKYRAERSGMPSRPSQFRSIDQIEAAIGDQGRGNPDPFWGLVILQDARQNPGQGQGTSVQGMGQSVLPIGIPVTQFQAIGLEGLKIGHRTDLQPAVLSRGEHLKIIGQGRGESQIATTEPEDAKWQFQLS